MVKKIIVFVLVVGVVSVGWYVWSHREPQFTNYPSKGKDIVAFGDSLIQGVGASSKDKNFVSLLSQKIGQPIINLGVSGNTTQDGLERLSQLDRYKPKVVLLLLGGNDHLRRVPIETTFENLSHIIENIQARGAVIVLLGVRGSLLTDNFDTYFRDLRDKYGTAYVEDVLSGLFGNNKYMSDVIHPNDLGYEKIAERIYPILEKAL